MKGLLSILRKRFRLPHSNSGIVPLDPAEERNLDRLRRQREAQAGDADA